MMKVIGLTGPSGAGKGFVASLFALRGIPSIDTDAVYHALLKPPSPCLHELVARFGEDILSPDGTLNRPVLAARVFAAGHESERGDLNRITHRYVLDEVRRRLSDFAKDGVPAVLVDAPQLFESGFDAECHYTLGVLAPRDVRLARIMARDGLEEARAEARLSAAAPDALFRERCDAVICNDGKADLASEVERLLSLWEVTV